MKNVIVHQPTFIHKTAKIGEGTKIGAFCDIGRDVIIGEDCWIQCHVTISNGTKIGNNVFIAPNVSFLNDKFPPSKRLSPPIIEDDVIIGGCAVIMPCVTVGRRSVVGSGTVVSKDVPPEVVVIGNPMKIIMTREEYERRKKQYEEGNLF